MKWLYRIVALLYGCRHKWEIIQRINIYEFNSDSRPCEIKYIMKCTKCGKMTKKST